MISLHNLSYQVNNRTILDQLEIQFKPGECFVIMGPSGCGKSTLLRLIMGLIKPSAGFIEIFEKNTASFSKKDWQELRNKMGMVFQSAALFDSMTVFENVAFRLRRNGLINPNLTEKVLKSLAIVGLTEADATKMPADLSGGMKKRAAIARAIATEPPLLLYDEPTTGLDPLMANTINDLIRHLQHNLGITSLVVTHDIVSALKVADRIGLLHNGQLVEVCERQNLSQAKHPLLKEFLKDYNLSLI